MATVRWRGDAAAIAQVNTITPASIGIGNTFTVTCNGKTMTYTAVDTLAATVAAGIVALFTTNAQTNSIPEFNEVTATVGSGTVVLTAKTLGKPFTITSSASGGTATFVTAATTANSGPNDANVVANWSGGALPSAADDVILDDTDADILWNVDALSAIALASFTTTPTFSGAVGLNYDAGAYAEYRVLDFIAKATTITINSPKCKRMRLNASSTLVTLNVVTIGTSDTTGLPALNFIGTNASNVVNIAKGSVGLAARAGQVATVLTLRAGYLNSQAGDVTVWGGSGLTLTTLEQSGGDVTLNGALTTVNKYAGTLTLLNAATITTFNHFGGHAYHRSSGTITTYDGRAGSTLHMDADPRGRTMTTTTLRAGSGFRDPGKTVTFTNPVSVPDGSLCDLTSGSTFGPNRTYAIT
jgi:hypothetical protein